MKELTIIRLLTGHEAKILSRNRVLLSLLLILVALLLGTLWAGNSLIRQQRATIGFIGKAQAESLAQAKRIIREVEANGGVYPGYIWDDPTFAYNATRKEGSKYAVKVPFALQVLNVGQSDIQPFYYRVNPKFKQDLTHESEIRNSVLQFIGNFDFSFVVVYLLPLLIIIFSYNVLSSEKEQGTWVLLKTTNQSIARIVLYRILIRYTFFTLLFWAVVTLVLASLVGPAFLATSNWWWVVVLVSLYFGFWFALSFSVSGFSLSSNVNSLVLIFVWLVTTIIVPNVIQIGLERVYPIPSRMKLVADEREAVNRFYREGGTKLTQDLIENPLSMIRGVSVVTPELVYGYGVVAYARQEVAEKASLAIKGQLSHQQQAQQSAIQSLMYASPALMLQEQLSALTGTHFYQFERFSADVDRFRQELLAYVLPKISSKSTYHSFTAKDADAIPDFRRKTYHDYGWMNLPVGLAVYLALTLAMILAGYNKLLKSERY